MFKQLKSRAQRKKHETHELELKRSLKEKLALYERRQLILDSMDTGFPEYTEITVEGNQLRVQKNNVTFHDVETNTFFIKPVWRMI